MIVFITHSSLFYDLLFELFKHFVTKVQLDFPYRQNAYPI